jgi:hypothetical protein
LKPAEFYDLTWSEYQRASIGYKVRLDRQWDIARHQIAMNGMTKARPNQIYQCIFDETIKPDPMTPEEWKELKRKWRIADA